MSVVSFIGLKKGDISEIPPLGLKLGDISVVHPKEQRDKNMW